MTKLMQILMLTAFLMFISVWLFWTQSSRRDWLMYPNFNHVSYSYYFGVLSFLIHTLASYILYWVSTKGLIVVVPTIVVGYWNSKYNL